MCLMDLAWWLICMCKHTDTYTHRYSADGLSGRNNREEENFMLNKALWGNFSSRETMKLNVNCVLLLFRLEVELTLCCTTLRTRPYALSEDDSQPKITLLLVQWRKHTSCKAITQLNDRDRYAANQFGPGYRYTEIQRDSLVTQAEDILQWRATVIKSIENYLR